MGAIRITFIIKNHHQGRYSTPDFLELRNNIFTTFLGDAHKIFGIFPSVIGVSINPALISLMYLGMSSSGFDSPP